MDGGAWWAVVHGVAGSRTRLSDFPFTFHFHSLEKEMATHSSVLAWRIPRTGEPGGLPSLGLHRVGHDWSNLAAAAAACIHCILFIHSFVLIVGNLGCLYFSVMVNNATMNYAAMNSGIQIHVWVPVFSSFAYILRGWMAGSNGRVLCSTFWGRAICFPQRLHLCAFYIPTNSIHVSTSLPTLVTFYIAFIFKWITLLQTGPENNRKSKEKLLTIPSWNQINEKYAWYSPHIKFYPWCY